MLEAKASRLAIEIVFDGGSRGNPGPAYGSYLLSGLPGGTPTPVRLHLGKGTNNEAEYRSLIAALDQLRHALGKLEIDPARVHLLIKGDSQLVINQLAGSWKIKNERMRALWEQAAALLEGLGSVRMQHHDRQRSVEILGH